MAGYKVGLDVNNANSDVQFNDLHIAISIYLALVGALLGGYNGRLALREDNRFVFIRSIAITFAAIGGTSFLGSDLTDADFTQAVLKSANFQANLTHTCFNNAQKLDQAKVGGTYLENPDVRQLVITGEGQEKNFDHGNLRGVNLARANLVGANFIGADLSKANLQDVDLSRAKLVQAQLDKTDFTGATLTGAFIEDWGITSQTKFNGVRCEYVFMRLPTKKDPDPWRKPDNRNEVFNDGEFGDFIKPIVDTLDLYHSQGVDPRAIAISFKQLAEKNPDAELRIAGMEVKGEDKFLLRAKTAQEANKSELSAEYFEIYTQVKALEENKVQVLMAEKDSRISSLETMVNTALKKPNYYTNTQVEQVGIMTNNPGGFSVGGSVDGNINNVQGNNNRTIKSDNNQGVIGDNNQVTQSQGTTSPQEPLTKEQVIESFIELDKLVQGAELPEDTKEEVIMYLGAAKKATEKEKPKKETVLANLESVAETLETASRKVDAGKTLWDKAKPIILQIADWFGAAAASHIIGL
ncbi:pentapeptide repeat-containing protein [Moorena sp. SIO4A5]|uniref:pentapeptide repeat-containing protein n=1 Tax=Moorena sp. SIO4A5 TaxID=2607838 RepID=UPI0025D1B1BE|nr:pentapeptide repeat-containing protein [Moorena sp. SIO4A5]